MKTKHALKVWFITGIARGLGRELAQVVLHEGDLVIGKFSPQKGSTCL